jgi:hypothetical protein
LEKTSNNIKISDSDTGNHEKQSEKPVGKCRIKPTKMAQTKHVVKNNGVLGTRRDKREHVSERKIRINSEIKGKNKRKTNKECEKRDNIVEKRKIKSGKSGNNTKQK